MFKGTIHCLVPWNILYLSMISQDIVAVITGDVVDSTAISKDYRSVLETIAEEIKEYLSPNLLFDIYRGDGFQVFIEDPTKALLISMLFRAGLRRYSRGSSIDEAWDARISVGIGSINGNIVDSNTKLGVLNGEAFVRSGRALDLMKKEGARLKITTGEEQLDKEFESTCPLADIIISKWTTAQAEAIYLSLLKNITQKEIGTELNTTQRAISKRLESSNLDSMTKFFNRYNEVIQWKYSN